MAQTLTFQLASRLREQIESGELRPGDRLPPHSEIALKEGVSEITVRAALRELREAGLIEVRRRIGTIVCGPRASGVEGGLETSLSGEKTVALVLPALSDPFFSRIAHGAEKECARQGLRLLLVTSGGNLELEKSEVTQLGRQVAGLAIFPVALRAHEPYLELQEKSVPLVFIDRAVEGVEASLISTDNERAGYLAGRHLISLGRPIWVMSQPVHLISPLAERLAGFRRALDEAGLPFHPGRVLQPAALGGEDVVGATLTRRFLASSDAHKPFSLLPINDYMGRGCYAALQEAGISVPHHAALATFGDSIGALLEPPMTAVWMGEEQWGREAVRFLAAKLRGEAFPARFSVEPHLIVRASCGADQNFCRVTALLEGTHTPLQMNSLAATPAKV